MADQTITCTDCSKQFQFTESEQEFYRSKDFSTPGRCPECRAARKAARQGGSSYNSGSTYGGASNYGSASYANTGYGSASYGERQMYPAVCARCNKDTQVPFQPRGDKPVYCSDCFRAQQGGSSSSYGSRGRSGGRY